MQTNYLTRQLESVQRRLNQINKGIEAVELWHSSGNSLANESTIVAVVVLFV